MKEQPMMNLEQAQETRNSVIWKNVCIELDYRIYAKLNELKNCAMEEVVNLQRDIKQLENLKKLPEDVIDRETIPQ